MRRDQIEELFYGKPEQQRRFTQDFPILPDVWIEYGKAPGQARRAAADAAQRIRRADGWRGRCASGWRPIGSAGRKSRGKTPRRTDRPRVLFNESVVLASLSFRELLRDAMPLTNWWQRVVAPIGSDWTRENIRRRSPPRSSKPDRGEGSHGRPGATRSCCRS